ncbi:MAG: hypothetical protein ABI612_06680, partial [Betaproteobacteria bacterium]
DRTEGARSDEIIERVQAFLEGHWVVSAADIAAKMEMDEAALLRHLTSQQRVVGVLTGPPSVLFIRPEGLRPE